MPHVASCKLLQCVSVGDCATATCRPADHFLLHAGGYAILRGIQKGLHLPSDKMLPSFVSLRDFGNTSSASTWYTFSYIESTSGMKRGEHVMQVSCHSWPTGYYNWLASDMFSASLYLGPACQQCSFSILWLSANASRVHYSLSWLCHVCLHVHRLVLVAA